MRKKVMAVLLTGMLTAVNIMPVCATEAETENAEQETVLAEETSEENAQETAEESEADTGIVIPQGNMVDVEVIDLSLHKETTGDFTAVYAYENPFKGQDTSQGVVIEFYAKPTWEVHELGAIFAINGSGAYDGKLYFSPGSYLGFNSPGFGGYFDANLFNYTIVTDYIKDGALIRIELVPEGFAVYANDELCYDQTILDNSLEGAGDFTSSSDFSSILEWISGAEALYFGYGSWWNGVGANEANVNLSQISFRLQDGTVLMDQLRCDKDLVESLGGSVDAVSEETVSEIKLADVDVEIFDIESVSYEGESVLPVMTAVVVIAVILTVIVVAVVCKPRKYD
ncbi:MAG: hypothetical protein J6D08_05565 [Lachnospiraceae bacterium]|nr:hypothetical protein [Lachnospiraceae bacterium]